MDSIKEKQTTDPFPLETLNRLKTAAAPGAGKTSDYTARNYDNRARLSDMAGQLQSKLDAFQTRINTSAFLSEAFTWRVNSARTDDSDRLLAKAESILQPVDYSLKISRLATSWATESDKLSSNDASPVETGTYSYTLTIDDTAYEIDVEIENNIGDPATNRDVLLAVERSINRLGLDVTASLEDFQEKNVADRLEGSFRKMSYLKVSRSSTGENLSASLADTEGDLIETLGLKGARQFGHNSEYRINGALFEDDANTVSFVSGKVAAHLSGITGNDENLKIMIDRDARYLAQELESVIGSYNELIDWIDDNGSVINSRLKDALFTDMDRMATRPKTDPYPGARNRSGRGRN